MDLGYSFLEASLYMGPKKHILKVIFKWQTSVHIKHCRETEKLHEQGPEKRDPGSAEKRCHRWHWEGL